MKQKNPSGLERLAKSRYTRSRFNRVVALLCVVVMCATMLTLKYQGITMEREPDCGIEAHEHTDACYHYTLSCGLDEDEGHWHTPECYAEVTERVCGLEENDGHEHTADCYARERVCGLAEGADHIHSEYCYVDVLTCELEEGDGAHRHAPECYATTWKLVCGKAEGEGWHEHTQACYTRSEAPVCGKAEHAHTEACYATHERLLAVEAAKAKEDAAHTEEAAIADDEPAGSADIDAPEAAEVEVDETGAFELGADASETEANADLPEDAVIDAPVAPIARDSESIAAIADDAGEVYQDAAYPAQRFEESTRYVKVTVVAGDGAFPADTTMRVSDVDDTRTIETISDAVAGEAAEDEVVEVKRVHAVDISFVDAAGQEIEPLVPISVVMTAVEVEPAEDTVVVHLDDAGNAQIVEQAAQEADIIAEVPVDEAEGELGDVALTAEDGTPTGLTIGGYEAVENDSGADRIAAEAGTVQAAFEADAFSVYALVVTETFTVQYIDAKGDTWVIDMTCGAQAQIPEGARLAVEEISGDDYDTYVNRTAEALEWDADRVSYAKVLDISIVDANGEKIQPRDKVAVSIRLLDRETGGDAKVVHFGQAPEVLSASTEGDTVSFEAAGFSIYAVVDETKRLKYIFHNGNSVAATEYVKQGEHLYDPGVEVEYGQTFIGWAFSPNEANEANVYSVGTLNQKLDSETDWNSVEDLQEVHVYAITREAYYLRYMTVDDHENEVVLKTVSVRTDEPNKNIQIDYDFTGEEGQTFEGWIDVSNGHLYELDDTLTLDHHIDLYSKVHGRNWLVFDSNAGGPGSGATYTPPQLLIGEATTTQPADPTRKGYSFQGWYTNPEGTGTPFRFGSTISEDTVLYAKWAPDNTEYYVIFWRQKASDEAGLPDDQKQYDYIESVKREALTDSTVTLQNADKRKSTGEYTNCTFNASLSDAQATVNADGTTTLNVYYDRNEYTLTFQVQGGYHYEYTPTTSNSGTQYGLVNGGYVQLTRHWRNNNYYWTYGDTYLSEGTRYTGTRYTREYTNWTTIHTITALYDHSIAEEFPITWNNGTRWLDYNGTYYATDQVLVSIDKMPAANIVFHWSSPGSRPTKTMNYYVQALDEETEEYQAAVYAGYPQSSKDVGTTSKETNYSYGGSSYNFALYDQIKARYNMVTELEDFIEITGFTRWTSDPRYINGVALDDSSHDGTINMYYTRNKYAIHYISQGPNVTERSEKQDDLVYYEASLAPYGLKEDDSWYYEPTNGKDGYFFAGWYEDEACTVPYDFNTRMPANDVTVYAKWDTQRVRVVLVPTKDNAHNDEVQMANNQALSFRLDYKELVSDENIKSGVIKRTGYRLVGWYTSPTFEEDTLWNFNTEVSKEVPAVNMNYQSSDNPDWVNNTYGDNDGAHDNVKGILKLYAKWELTVDENSVYVEYDVPEEYRTYNSQGNLQTTIPVDETAYVLTDQNITATVKEAPTGYADGFKFAGWQLLNADGSEASNVNPFVAGNTVQLDQSYIEERTITDDEGNTATIKIIRLKAKFDVDEENAATMVTFNGNGGVTNDEAARAEVSQAWPVNQDFTMLDEDSFVRRGYELVGWSFDPNTTADQFNQALAQHPTDSAADLQALAEMGYFKLGENVAADNGRLSEHNNWDPLQNTVYAVWKSWGYLKIGKHFDVQEFYLDGVDMETRWNNLEFTIKDSQGNYVRVVKETDGPNAGNFIYDGTVPAGETPPTIKLVDFVHETDPNNPHEHQYFLYAWLPPDTYTIEENHTQADTLLTGYTRDASQRYGSKATITSNHVYGDTTDTDIGSGDAGRIENKYRGDTNYAYLKVEKQIVGEEAKPLAIQKDYYFVVKNETLDAYVSTADRTFTTHPENIQIYRLKPGGAVFYQNGSHSGEQVNGNRIQVIGDNVYSIIELDAETSPVAPVSPELAGFEWEKTVSPETVTADKNKDKNVTITNKYTATFGSLELEKIVDEAGEQPDGVNDHEFHFTVQDSEGRYISLNQDGSIEVVEVAEGAAPPVIRVKPGAANKVTISYLEPGEYTVTELTETPDPYPAYTVEVSYSVDGGKATVAKGETAHLAVTNKYDRNYGDVTFKKVDADTNDGLKDAQFTLYTDEQCTTIARDKDGHDAVAASTDGGKVKFANLIVGTYYMKETQAPEGYVDNPNVYKVEVTRTGEGDEAVVSSKITLNDETVETPVALTEIPNTPITVKVVLEKYTVGSTVKLAGAHFDLYDVNPEDEMATPINEKDIVSVDEDEDPGYVELGDLKLGTTYYLVETQAPEGYVKLSTPVAIHVEMDAETKALTVWYQNPGDNAQSIKPTTVNDDTVTIYAVKVYNNPGARLPSTGGPGTRAFTAAGIALIALALTLLVIRRRRA